MKLINACSTPDTGLLCMWFVHVVEHGTATFSGITFYRNREHVLADQPGRFKTKSLNMTPSSGRKVWRFIILSC
jgi:hypothetical protein